MSRKIKFRAWIRADKKMAGVKLIGGGYCWLDDVWIDSKTNLNASAHEIGVTCDVMQFTGVKAQNGDIYDGDIVKAIGGDIKWQVCYDRWGIPALARIDYCMGTDFKEMEIQAKFPPSKLKILGNMYANPELLKIN